jgi:DNA polymerase I-like protein with 3'-5' exonuclease and polymerase domains
MYRVVRDATRLGEVANEINQASAIGLDTETTHLSPHHGKLRLAQINTGQNIYLIDLFHTKTLGPVAEVLNEGKAVKVGQNLKFDQKFLLHEYGIELWPLFDTFRASALLNNGKQVSNGLYDIYERELGMDGHAPDMADSSWTGELSEEQLAYAAEDVEHLLTLRQVMKPKLAQDGLNRTALIEFQAILAEASMELNGFFLNRETWGQLYEENRVRRDELKERLFHEMPHPRDQLGLPGLTAGWNLGSPKQKLQSLHRLGVPVDNTREMTLAMFAAKFPVIKTLIEYNKVSKLCTAFGPDYLRHVDSVTGRVHTNFYPFLAAGRYSCVAPWTPIRTRAGTKRMEDVRVGDQVWTHRNRWRPVLKHWLTGVEPVYRVHLSNGEVLTCTDTHNLLRSDGRWMSIKEMRYECVQTLGEQARECSSRTGPVPVGRESNDGGDSRTVGGESGECSPHHPNIAAKRVFGGEEEEVQCSQSRREQSPLDRKVRQLEGTPDYSCERETGASASSGHGRGFGVGGSAVVGGSSSHRQRSEQQFAGEPGTGDPCWTPDVALFAGEGRESVRVVAIYPCGSLPVYDVTVADDSSYETLGMFSHNSSKPNLQQIPRQKRYRKAFAAPPGRIIVVADYSQIELRLVAQISLDRLLMEVYRKGLDAHRQTAALVNEVSLDDVTKDMRQSAKPVNFGLCIAAGQRVLTHVGLVPIEQVRDWHLVWDGVDWVKHDGVVFMGHKRVITHDGLTATPDHEVYTHDGYKVPLWIAASSLRFGRLADGGVGEATVGYTAFDRRSGEAGAESQVRGADLFCVQQPSLGPRGQHPWGQDSELSMSEEQVWGFEELDLGQALRLHGAALRAGYPRFVAPLQGAWDQGVVRVQGALRSMGTGDLPGRVLREAHGEWPGGEQLRVRPDRQQRALFPGQSASDDLLGESEESGVLMPVYDLMNAGPRHRFTVEGKVVSNCYGMGAEKLVLYAMQAYGIALKLEDAEKFRERYFEGYAGVRAWHRRMLAQGKRTGISRTLSGRIRYLEENAHNEILNTPVQGSGADGLKAALPIVYERLKKYGGRAKLVHMVHDEIVIETDDVPDEPEAIKTDLEDGMKEGMQPFLPDVPVVVEGAYGPSWAEH